MCFQEMSRIKSWDLSTKGFELYGYGKMLAKKAESVQATLDQLNIASKVVELPSSTRTVVDAAASIGCELSQIVKSLIFRTSNIHQPVLVLVSGSHQVDVKKIEAYVNEAIEKADADFVKEVTGFTIGGIPPIGHKNKIDRIFIDQNLLNFDEVWAAAGTPNSVFSIKGKELLRITGGKLVRLD